MLVDTDVLIWYMRGSDKALRAIEGLDGFSIPMVTYIELVQELRSKAELNALRNFLRAKFVALLPITESISSNAMFYNNNRVGPWQLFVFIEKE